MIEEIKKIISKMQILLMYSWKMRKYIRHVVLRLSLINIDYSKIKAHPKILKYYENLKI